VYAYGYNTKTVRLVCRQAFIIIHDGTEDHGTGPNAEYMRSVDWVYQRSMSLVSRPPLGDWSAAADASLLSAARLHPDEASSSSLSTLRVLLLATSVRPRALPAAAAAAARPRHGALVAARPASWFFLFLRHPACTTRPHHRVTASHLLRLRHVQDAFTGSDFIVSRATRFYFIVDFVSTIVLYLQSLRTV